MRILMPKPILRSKLLIYPKFQLLLIGINSILTIGAFVVTLFEVSHEFARFKELGNTIKLAPDHPYFKMIRIQENSLALSLITAFLITLILSGFVTLIISHRLAGPIVRMKGFLKEISQSPQSQTQLSFRKGDFFDDLPGALNQALDAVRKDQR